MADIKSIFSKEAEKQIIEINKGINSVYKSIQDINSTTIKVTSSKDYTTQQAKLNKELASQNTSMKQIERGTKALTIAKSEAGVVTAKLKLETQLVRKANKELAKETLGLSSASEKLTRELKEARKVYRDYYLTLGDGNEKTKEAKKRAVELAETQKKLNQDVKFFGDTVGNYPKKVGILSKSFGLLKKALGGVAVLFGASQLINYGKELNELANRVKGIDFAFEKLGERGVKALNNIRTSTRGLVSNLDIKKSLVEFDNFNISLEETDTLFEFLAVRATQTGESIDSLKSSLVEGLSKESKLRIDNLGISTSQLNEELERTPDFVQAVANIAEREIAKAGNVLDEASSNQEKWNVQIANTKERLATGLKPSFDLLFKLGNKVLPIVVNYFVDLSNAVSDFVGNLQIVSKTLDPIINKFNQLKQSSDDLAEASTFSSKALKSFFYLIEKAVNPFKGILTAVNSLLASINGFGSAIVVAKNEIVKLFEVLDKTFGAFDIKKPIESLKNIDFESIKTAFTNVGKESAKAYNRGYDEIMRTDRSSGREVVGRGGSDANKPIKDTVKVVPKLRKEIKLLEKELTNLTKNGYNNLNKAQVANILKTRESIEAKKNEIKTILNLTDKQKKESKRIAEIIKSTTESVESDNLKAIEKIGDAYNSGTKSAEEYLKAVEEINDKTAKNIVDSVIDSLEQIVIHEDLTKQELEDQEKALYDFKQQLRQLDLEDIKNKAKEEIALAKKISDSVKDEAQKRVDIGTVIFESGQNKLTQIEEEETEKRNELKENAKNLSLAIANTTFGVISELSNRYFEQRITELDEYLERATTSSEKEQEEAQALADAGVITQEEADAKKAQSIDKLAQIERGIRIEQAKAEKKANLFQAIISAALAVVTGLAEGGPPLAAANAIAGAASVALIASEPIPQFKTGVTNFEGGLATIGDGGAEILETPDGNQFYVPNEITTYLPKGSNVYTNKETNEMMKNDNSIGNKWLEQIANKKTRVNIHQTIKINNNSAENYYKHG